MKTIVLDECGIVDVIARYYKCGTDKVRLTILDDENIYDMTEIKVEVDKE